jgi:AraC-like DNA-binding protein
VGGHDRDTAGADRDTGITTVSVRDAHGTDGAVSGGTRESTPALLQTALEQLRLQGAIFFRSEMTDAFQFESTPNDIAGVLHEGAHRIILFHIVAKGSCWVGGDDGVRHRAEAGDVIVIPYGDPHFIGGATPAECVSMATLMNPPPWDVMPVIRHGGGGDPTDLVCGYLHSDDPLFDPALRVFPRVFVVRLPPGATGWVTASVTYSLEETALSNRSSSLVAQRLPELVLIEVLRFHLATAPAADQGWLAALRDPVLAPALSLLHGEPDRRWTVAELASGAAVSRSLLDDRLRQVLGLSPIRYLTEWRMHLAEELLATTDLGVVAIARRIGYDSEEGFSRAFKRGHGLSPSHWRDARAGGSLDADASVDAP